MSLKPMAIYWINKNKFLEKVSLLKFEFEYFGQNQVEKKSECLLKAVRVKKCPVNKLWY